MVAFLEALGLDRIGQGFQNMMMRGAGLSQAQIEIIDDMKEKYPAVDNLNLANLLNDDSKTGLKDRVLQMLEKPGLADSFGQQLQSDPALVDRLNYLIDNDPNRLDQMLPQFEEHPDQLAGILKGGVTEEQAQVAHTASAQAAQNPMAALQNFDIGNFFSGLGQSFNLENIAQALLSMVNGIYGMVGGLVGGLANFAKSGEFVAAGNGVTDPNSPFQQIARMVGTDPTVHHEGPEGVTTAPLSQQPAAAAPAPASPPAPDQQPQVAAPPQNG